MAAADVQVGDRVRLAGGDELVVARLERDFLGIAGMVALIEDSGRRWFKQPLPGGTEVEVRRDA